MLGIDLKKPTLENIKAYLTDLWNQLVAWWPEIERTLLVKFVFPTWEQIKKKAQEALTGEGLQVLIGSIAAAAGALPGVALLLRIIKFGTPVGIIFTIADVLAGGKLSGWFKGWIESGLARPELQIAVDFFKSNWNAFLQNLGIGGTDDTGTTGTAGVTLPVTPAWIADPIGHLKTKLTDKFKEEGVGFTITDGDLTVTIGDDVVSFVVPGLETLKESFLKGFFSEISMDELSDFNATFSEFLDSLARLTGLAIIAAIGTASFSDELTELIGEETALGIKNLKSAMDGFITTVEKFFKYLNLYFEYQTATPERQSEIRWQIAGEVAGAAGGFLDEVYVEPFRQVGDKLAPELDEMAQKVGLEPSNEFQQQKQAWEDHELFGDTVGYGDYNSGMSGGLIPSIRSTLQKLGDGLETLVYDTLNIPLPALAALNRQAARRWHLGDTENDDIDTGGIGNQDSGGISVARTLRWLSYNNRPEAIIPLHRFDEVMRPFVNQMMPAMAGGSGTVQIDQRVGDIHVNVSGGGGDANAIAREVGAEVRKQFRDLADEMDSAIRR